MDGRQPRITVLGSSAMDVVAYTEVAPARGETVFGRDFRTVPGGKGSNQAIAAARAGAEVAFIGAVGTDQFGTVVREALSVSGVDVSLLRTVPGSTGVAHIVVDDSGNNAIVIVPAANSTVVSLAAEDVTAIERCDTLLLQLELPMEAAIAGAVAGRAAGVRVVLTPAPARSLPAKLLDNVDLLVPNEHEAAAVTGLADPAAALAALLERVPEVVVTLGSSGCLYGRRGAEPVAVPAPRVSAVDTTAAGDTFVGALAVALAEGREAVDALVWASAAAALSVQRRGASSSMPSRAEIEALASAG